MVDFTAAKNIAKLVTFMPLPGEPGAEPINDIIIMIKMVAGTKELRSQDRTPELREATAWNIEFITW